MLNQGSPNLTGSAWAPARGAAPRDARKANVDHLGQSPPGEVAPAHSELRVLLVARVRQDLEQPE